MRFRSAAFALVALLLVPTLPASAAEPGTDASSGRGSPLAPGARPGHLDPDGRYIVVLDADADALAVSQRLGRAEGLRTERVFQRAVRGFSGRLTPSQVIALKADPDVAAVVPDEIVEVASQLVPTGVSRIGARLSQAARIDGLDQRVNADVAIIDTGIDPNHPDLNVVGGVNCSSSNRALWRDVEGHGTHVAGTVGAIDNGSGVVGVAPGVRLWAVKILDDTGFGYLSWYVCGLDWIASQRDPTDPSRPLIEAVNMSVAKWGTDGGSCGATTNDILHQAICRVTNAGVTVVAAAANDSGSAAARVPAAYNEVITVSALADTDGVAGGTGGPRCYSWGSYDVDDTFANFSNYGYDVDLIAPGKCIWSTLPDNRYGYSSGTSMAAPAVTGAAALFMSTRPWARPSDVKAALQMLGNTGWKTSTDPDSTHERLLDVSRLSAGGDFSLAVEPPAAVGEGGGTVVIPIDVNRTPTSFETIRLVATTPPGLGVSLDDDVLTGFTSDGAVLTVTVPTLLPPGRYPVIVTGAQGSRVREATAEIVVDGEPPVALPPVAAPAYRYSMTGSTAPVRVVWPAAVDPSSTIVQYELQHSMDWGPWGPSRLVNPPALSNIRLVEVGHSHRFRLRAQDAVGNWSEWVTGVPLRLGAIDDQSTVMRYSAGWTDEESEAAWLGKISRTSTPDATVTVLTAARTLALAAEVGPTGGWIQITINGIDAGRVSLWARERNSASVLWVITLAADSPLLVELKAVTSGARNTANVDALLVGR